MTGTLVSMQTVEQDRFGRAIGVLHGEDGKFYTCDNGHFFRNGSFVLVGHRYNFDVVDFTYATNIDLIDKQAGLAALQQLVRQPKCPTCGALEAHWGK